MKYIQIDKNPWLQYGAKVPIADANTRTIETAMTKFLHKNGVLLNRIAYAWSEEDGKFKIVNNDNGAIIAVCSIQNVTPKV